MTEIIGITIMIIITIRKSIAIGAIMGKSERNLINWIILLYEKAVVSWFLMFCDSYHVRFQSRELGSHPRRTIKYI